jgi:predicted RNA-binding protein with RPS1 domain
MVTTETETAPVTALQPKARLTGKIIKITLAGALVDVGQSVPGVLHISQIRKDPVNKVEDVLQDGQAVDVWVRRVRKDRIELTMIEPLRYEWKDMQPDMVVNGKVVRLETYGAFIDIGAERPGMIHISELARGYVKEAKDVIKEGDEVEAKILSVDAKKRQIRLSLKALQPEVATPPAPEREGKRGKRGKKSEKPEQTQERSKSKDKSSRAKRQRSADAEQEEILSRTLEKRVPTGA